ncbi:MAG: FAD-dependent oxidoreductase [Acinetobacter sp.]
MHIAIIGAGISGLLSALELLEHGCSITLIDQNLAGKEASWAGGGILSPMYPWRYPSAVNQLAQYGKSMYQQWNEKIYPITGIDFEIQDTGMLIFDSADFNLGLQYAHKYQEPMQCCELLTSPDIQKINPHVSGQFDQALYFPALANIRNPRLLRSIITYLKQHPKVQYIEQCAVQLLDIHQNQVNGVILANQQQLKADAVVLATGAWSEMWATQLQLDIPVRPIHGQMVLFKAPEQWLPTMCMNQVMYLIPRQDGHIVCGSSMNDFGFDRQPRPEIEQNIIDAVTEIIPEIRQFPVLHRWAGLRPSSPTGIPYIGKMPNIRNLWANFGHFRNGLCMGPASAQLLRQLMLQQTPLVNPQAYSPERLLADTRLH